jgi:hypothetical protein
MAGAHGACHHNTNLPYVEHDALKQSTEQGIRPQKTAAKVPVHAATFASLEPPRLTAIALNVVVAVPPTSSAGVPAASCITRYFNACSGVGTACGAQGSSGGGGPAAASTSGDPAAAGRSGEATAPVGWLLQLAQACIWAAKVGRSAGEGAVIKQCRCLAVYKIDVINISCSALLTPLLTPEPTWCAHRA